MDQLARHKQLVKQIVEEIAAIQGNPNTSLNIQLITDDEHGHYLLYNNQWREERRYYGCFLHIGVPADTGRIWIHHDGTDLIIAEKLLENGVSKQDIVLAHRSPIMRPDTGFAIA
ncbi:MAG: XisI protein [Saprospiraceae bacterium]|nr:XisI protein [Saprospiraceae bacterium]